LHLPGDDDRTMIDYLLGSLPEKEAERLDELSITDDDFAVRLNAAENDLVDAYVRGELAGETAQRFRSFYLSSPKRQEKVRFAEILLAHERRAAVAATKPDTAEESIRVQLGEIPKRPRGFFRLIPQWGFATAALLLLLATASLLIQNRRLNTEIGQSEAERARLEQNQQELEKQLQQQRAANAGTARAPSNAGVGSRRISMASVPAFVLSPALRGPGSITTISVPRGTKQIKVTLQLEAADFSKYRVTLNDPVTDQPIWRSAELTAQAAGKGKSVSALVSTKPLKEQNYAFEVSGITSRGTSEFISSYPFRFVVK
jgi:hypothetical protein